MQGKIRLVVSGDRVELVGDREDLEDLSALSLKLVSASKNRFKVQIQTKERPHGWSPTIGRDGLRVRLGQAMVKFSFESLENGVNGVQAVTFGYSTVRFVDSKKLGQTKRRSKKRLGREWQTVAVEVSNFS